MRSLGSSASMAIMWAPHMPAPPAAAARNTHTCHAPPRTPCIRQRMRNTAKQETRHTAAAPRSRAVSWLRPR